MDLFFGKDFPGGPFVLFSPTHMAAILVLVALNLSLLLLSQNASPAHRRAFRYGMSGLLLVDEVLWHLWNLTTGQWSIQKTLPLHLCSVFVILCAIMLVTRNYRIYEFAYFLGIAGATQAILTPDLGIYDFPHFRYFQVFLSHGLIVTSAVYMTVVEGFRPTWGSIKRTIVWTNVYMLLIGMVNALIGSNYLYIAHKPETASLMDVLGPWPWYILALEGIGLVLFLALYLPFFIRDLLVRRSVLAVGD